MVTVGGPLMHVRTMSVFLLSSSSPTLPPRSSSRSHASVRTLKMSPCVPATRPHEKDTWTWCRYTRTRFSLQRQLPQRSSHRSRTDTSASLAVTTTCAPPWRSPLVATRSRDLSHTALAASPLVITKRLNLQRTNTFDCIVRQHYRLPFTVATTTFRVHPGLFRGHTQPLVHPRVTQLHAVPLACRPPR